MIATCRYDMMAAFFAAGIRIDRYTDGSNLQCAGATPLHTAMACQDEAAVKLLLNEAERRGCLAAVLSASSPGPGAVDAGSATFRAFLALDRSAPLEALLNAGACPIGPSLCAPVYKKGVTAKTDVPDLDTESTGPPQAPEAVAETGSPAPTLLSPLSLVSILMSVNAPGDNCARTLAAACPPARWAAALGGCPAAAAALWSQFTKTQARPLIISDRLLTPYDRALRTYCIFTGLSDPARLSTPLFPQELPENDTARVMRALTACIAARFSWPGGAPPAEITAADASRLRRLWEEAGGVLWAQMIAALRAFPGYLPKGSTAGFTDLLAIALHAGLGLVVEALTASGTADLLQSAHLHAAATAPRSWSAVPPWRNTALADVGAPGAAGHLLGLVEDPWLVRPLADAVVLAALNRSGAAAVERSPEQLALRRATLLSVGSQLVTAPVLYAMQLNRHAVVAEMLRCGADRSQVLRAYSKLRSNEPVALAVARAALEQVSADIGSADTTGPSYASQFLIQALESRHFAVAQLCCDSGADIVRHGPDLIRQLVSSWRLTPRSNRDFPTGFSTSGLGEEPGPREQWMLSDALRRPREDAPQLARMKIIRFNNARTDAVNRYLYSLDWRQCCVGLDAAVRWVLERLRVAGGDAAIRAAIGAGPQASPCVLSRSSPPEGSPLSLAAKYGNVRAVRLLVQSGARFQEADALEAAAHHNRPGVFDMLLVACTPPADAANAAGVTDHAADSGDAAGSRGGYLTLHGTAVNVAYARVTPFKNLYPQMLRRAGVRIGACPVLLALVTEARIQRRELPHVLRYAILVALEEFDGTPADEFLNAKRFQ
jgi:hypothetical protein